MMEWNFTYICILKIGISNQKETKNKKVKIQKDIEIFNNYLNKFIQLLKLFILKIYRYLLLISYEIF